MGKMGGMGRMGRDGRNGWDGFVGGMGGMGIVGIHIYCRGLLYVSPSSRRGCDLEMMVGDV